ncbi:MAG: hypothetical protein ACHQLQ_05960 [Candidatus Acidiferrales bacterium]
MPTSFGGNESKVLLGINYLLCPILLSLLIHDIDSLASFPACLGLFSAIPVLVAITALSPIHEYSFGSLAAYAVVLALFVMNLRRLDFKPWLFKVFIVINIVNIVMGVCILFGSELVTKVLVNYYSHFYPELVPGMLVLRKPILTFGTHSLAGFFLYLFFYMNLRSYKAKGNKLFLVLALCYVCLTLALLSVTGLVLGCVGGLQILYALWSPVRFRWFWVSALFALIVLVASLQLPHFIGQYWTNVREGAKAILTSPGNGLLGRFTPEGTMYPGIQYAADHPFTPLGVSSKADLLIGDMGLLDYYLRGSVFLVVWAYAGLFFFLKRSLADRRDLYFLFSIIIAFELGFSSLTYFRTPYLLAFLVVYLNGLRESESQAAGALRMSHVPDLPNGRRGETTGNPA